MLRIKLYMKLKYNNISDIRHSFIRNLHYNSMNKFSEHIYMLAIIILLLTSQATPPTLLYVTSPVCVHKI